MLSNNSQLTKKDSSLRRRKSVISGAGVKHRLNCLSTLSALHSHSSSGVKKNRTVSRTITKPIKTMSKKSQENYVIRLGSQQLNMQQFTKSGSSVVVKEDEQDPELNLTIQQKIKFFFVLLMIPSAMFVFFGSNKFNNSPSVTIDPSVQMLGAMGGMGGLGGLGNLGNMAGLGNIAGGLPRGFPGGFNGFPGGHNSDHRRHHHESMGRDYDQYDPQSIQDHLERLAQNTGHREHTGNMRNRQRPQRSESTQRSHYNNNHQKPSVPVHDFNSHKTNEVNEQNMEEVLNSNSDSNMDSVKQKVENNAINEEIHKNSDQTQNQNSENTDKNIRMGDHLRESTSPIMNSQRSNAVHENNEPGLKTILLWTPIDGLNEGIQPFIDSKCVINKCIFTSNKSDSSQRDAIVFDARYVRSGALPNMRSSDQKWILFSRHSSDSFSGANLIPFSNQFTWSWTYRSDSDIVYNYANVKQSNVESNQLFKASDIFYIWRQKTKMILWFANNCQTNTKREDYVKQLTDYIDVDIYGKCSDKLNNNIDIDDENQIKSLSEKYLFVIAFEKNNCKDYVSKRLYKYLENNIIPIVMGGADYSKIVPPNSVINAKDFSSAKDLADFVLDIGSDFSKYKKYFEWKRNHQISYERKDLCQLCYKLHDQHNTFKTSPDIINWWLDSTQCQNTDPLNSRS